MQRELNVLNIILLFIFFSSCKAQIIENNSHDEKLYAIIESKSYNNSVLFHKTISSTDISNLRFNYESLNNHNFSTNWVLERGRFVNFDTIFNSHQQSEIDNKLKRLENVELQRSKLKNPDILYKPQSLNDGNENNKIGLEKISFPFIQKGLDGNFYGFIYRENPTEGIFYIYILKEDLWEEFAKVQLWIT